MQIYISGGVEKQDAQRKPGSHRYARGRLLRLDCDTGGRIAATEILVDHVTPPALAADDDPSVCFTAAHLTSERAWIPTKTEVLICRRPDFRVERVLTHPAFNDVHAAAPTVDGGTRVVSTGLDRVLYFDADDELRGVRPVLAGESTWGRFDPEADHRKIHSTKPHQAHPNFAFDFEGREWVTRFKQRDAVPIDAPDSARIPIDLEGCHDGVVHGGAVFFTTVDGHVVRTRPGLEGPERVWNLNELTPGLRKLGWCRGLSFLDDGRVLVGFSRLRLTRWRDNIGWAGGLAAVQNLGHRPTRLACYDLERGRLDFELEFEELDAVFSIHVEP